MAALGILSPHFKQRHHHTNSTSPTKDTMALIHGLPNELILLISAHLSASDLYHFILISRRFFFLLPTLHRLALGQNCAKTTLFWAVLSGNRDLARYMLEKGERKIAVLRGVRYIFAGECDEESSDWVMRQRSNLALMDCHYRFSPRPPSLARVGGIC